MKAQPPSASAMADRGLSLKGDQKRMLALALAVKMFYWEYTHVVMAYPSLFLLATHENTRHTMMKETLRNKGSSRINIRGQRSL